MSLITLLAFLLAGQASVQAYVWCVGADGHAGLKYGADDTCGSVRRGDTTDCCWEQKSDFSSGLEPCGSCLDIQLSLVSAFNRLHNSQDFSVQFVPVPVGLYGSARDLLRFFAAPVQPRLISGIPQVLRSLCTIVLLI